jgi:hypothetical protein
MTRQDILACCFALACSIYGCTAKADESTPPTTSRHSLTIVAHDSPVVGRTVKATAKLGKASSSIAQACPVDWTMTNGVCLPG